MKFAILGFGREGQSTLTYLLKQPAYRGAEFTILDKNKHVPIVPGHKYRLGADYLKHLNDFDIIFRSPGVPWMAPELVAARKRGVKFSSLMNLFFEAAARKTANIIGVTGTKGKGTTSTLLYEIWKAAKRPVQLAGNIGKPALDILPKISKDSWIILELSSFQLQDLQYSPHIALMLDVFPDHQDAHKDLEEYFEAKAQIAAHQRPGDRVFFFAENPTSVRLARGGRGKKIPVPTTNFELFRPEDLSVRGEHNYRNAVMAATVARTLGIPNDVILKTTKKFTGLDHRLQFVRRLPLKMPGVKGAAIAFWDDSASTNPHTSAVAIRSFPGANNILIAGGQDKNLDYEPLAAALSSDRCLSGSTLVILFGENRYKIKKALVKACAITEMATTLKSALDFAVRTAKDARASTNIIFSPGAASFDMFQNYADRGEHFQKLVRELR